MTNSSTIFNLPNQITIARLVLSVIMFVGLHFGWYWSSLVIFVAAASTDWVDGYLARKLGQVTQLGRILDPFADKIIICGTFIFLAAIPESRIAAWMTVVVVGRELLVTVLRSYLEQQGRDFSANMPGKLKMVFQCAAAVGGLLLAAMATHSTPSWLVTTTVVLIWAAVLSTVYSGVIYVFAAIRMASE